MPDFPERKIVRAWRWWRREWTDEHAWFFGLKWLVFAVIGYSIAWGFGIYVNWENIR